VLKTDRSGEFVSSPSVRHSASADSEQDGGTKPLLLVCRIPQTEASDPPSRRLAAAVPAFS
jgi:hypothetical protein